MGDFLPVRELNYVRIKCRIHCMVLKMGPHMSENMITTAKNARTHA